MILIIYSKAIQNEMASNYLTKPLKNLNQLIDVTTTIAKSIF